MSTASAASTAPICVMLAETGILPRPAAAAIARALEAIDAEIDVDALTYTGELEDFFFSISRAEGPAVGPDLGGAPPHRAVPATTSTTPCSR